MPTEPAQLILAVFELALLLVGAFLVVRLLAKTAVRTRWLKPGILPPWPVTLPEFFIFVFLIFSLGVFCSLGLHALLKDAITRAADSEVLEVCLNGVGLDGGGLVGWLIFPTLRRHLHADYGAAPSPEPFAAPALPWSKALLFGAGTLLVALPVITVFSLGWTFLLRELGLPDEPQELLAIFSKARSPFVIAGMLAVACGLAPLYEELLFRGGLYRFCRQRLGRNWALLLSGCLFGAMHQNLMSFLPLSIFGVILALAYEATGSIRVAVIAHALFNLNTIVIVLSGLQQ